MVHRRGPHTPPLLDDDTKELRALPSVVATDGTEARLLVVTGPFAGRTFDVGDGVLIGRGSGADVRIDETSVSRSHARITRAVDGRYAIEDLGSRNGTIVDGQPIERHELSYGDRVQIGGSTVLLFTLDDPSEDQLRRRQRLEAIGELSAGVAHDFNNLLGAILASVSYLEEIPAGRSLRDPEARECIADIHSAARRGAELTERLLLLARRGRSVDAPVDMTRLCEEVVQLARRTFPRRITVRGQVSTDLALIGNYSQLYHSLLNLCINARDAMTEGGLLTMTARRYHETGDPTSRGDYVEITVSDTGIGMDQETVRRAFEPFFTTKGGEAGSGLGLASVLGTVRGHGGRVDVWSEPGRGATFRLLLPTRTHAPPATPVGDERRHEAMDTPIDRDAVRALVLLVDDDHVLRRSLGRILRKAGHDLAFAEDGETATLMYRTAKRRPDVVLLDLDMPRLGGAEAFARLREIDPRVRVVLMSGITTEEQRAELLSKGACDFLQKPVPSDTLVKAVQRALFR